jgi:limonene-1,2-epoxide hydrolase
MASAGDVVLTERVDKMFRKDDSLILDFRIMGALEVRDGKIVRYTDYLDSLGTARTLERLAAEMGHDRAAGHAGEAN